MLITLFNENYKISCTFFKMLTICNSKENVPSKCDTAYLCKNLFDYEKIMIPDIWNSIITIIKYIYLISLSVDD